MGKGVWGLRDYEEDELIYMLDVNNSYSIREETTLYRIIRDTELAKKIKRLHNHRCQICGETIKIGDKYYSEAHHIKPLGKPHNGPDISQNIIILCPNHHVLCDYGGIKLDINNIQNIKQHELSEEFIDYHNKYIYKRDK